MLEDLLNERERPETWLRSVRTVMQPRNAFREAIK
jgi:hypothetical protein